MIGLTLDTGALIALERRRTRVTALLRAAREDGAVITVPANVVAEWWRGRTDLRESILDAVVVEPTDGAMARKIGETLASIRGATLVDATVMVSAATRGDVVLTADVEHFTALATRFPSVRVLTV